jgi:hypothetical protein
VKNRLCVVATRNTEPGLCSGSTSIVSLVSALGIVAVAWTAREKC